MKTPIILTTKIYRWHYKVKRELLFYLHEHPEAREQLKGFHGISEAELLEWETNMPPNYKSRFDKFKGTELEPYLKTTSHRALKALIALDIFSIADLILLDLLDAARIPDIGEITTNELKKLRNQLTILKEKAFATSHKENQQW